MGTRYDEGDLVMTNPQFFDGQAEMQRGIYEIDHIRQPESDSPEYHLNPVITASSTASGYLRASDLEKFDLGGFAPETVTGMIDAEIKDAARRKAARTWSVDYDVPADLIVAKFGNFIGVNGELEDSAPDTSEMEVMDQWGGKVPTSEEEIELWQVTDDVSRDNPDIPRENLEEVVDILYGSEGFTYAVVSGRTTYYEEEE